MPTNIYQTVTNPIAGETFRCISATDEAYTMEWVVQPRGYVPFEHVHFNQDEIFRVEEGETRIIIDGKEHIAGAGQRICVPKGAQHIAYNNQPTLLKTVVEYKPGLDQATFSACFLGLMLDGHYDQKGSVDIPKMGYFLKRIKAQCLARPTSIPAPLFHLALNFFTWSDGCGAGINSTPNILGILNRLIRRNAIN